MTKESKRDRNGEEREQKKPARLRLSGESLEPRLLMSATWVEADADDMDDVGDTPSSAVDDFIESIADDGAMTHDGGTESADFSTPEPGATYVVNGAEGSGTIDLASYPSSAISFGEASMTVDMGDGESFSIEYTNVDQVQFADVTATVLSGDHTESSFKGSEAFIEGDQAFMISLEGRGSIDWSYDSESDSLSISDTNHTKPNTTIIVNDLNGTDLNLESFTVDRPVGSLVSDVDVGTLTFNGNGRVEDITIGDGSGTIDHLEVTKHNFNHDLTVNGNVDELDFEKIGKRADIHVTGGVDSFSIVGNVHAKANITVDGDLGSLTAHKFKGDLTVGGDLGSLTAARFNGDLIVGGDLDNVVTTHVFKGSITAHEVTGSFHLDAGKGNVISRDFSGPTTVTWNHGEFSAEANEQPVPDTTEDTASIPETGEAQEMTEDPVTPEATTIETEPEPEPLPPSPMDPPPVADMPAEVASEPSPPTGVSEEADLPAVDTGVTPPVPEPSGSGDPITEVPESEGTEAPTDTDTMNEAPVTAEATITEPEPEPMPPSPMDPPPVADMLTEAVSEPSPPTGASEEAELPAVDTDDPSVDASAGQTVSTADPVNVQATADVETPEDPRDPVERAMAELKASRATETGVFEVLESDPSPVADTPSVDAGLEQTVIAGDTVTLQATTTNLDSETLEYAWTQVGGTPVVLSCATVAAPCFDAPEPMRDESLIFEVTASDGTTTTTDTVSVTVKAGRTADVETPEVGLDPVELAMAELRASRATENGVLEVLESGEPIVGHRHADAGGVETRTEITAPSDFSEVRGGRQTASPDSVGATRIEEESSRSRDHVLPVGTAGIDEPGAEEQQSSWMKLWRSTLGFFRSGSATDKK